jgi:hypothetical protein
VVRGIRGALGRGDITGGLHEPAELRDRHRVLVHPEAIYAHPVDRPLLRVELL